MPSTAYGAPVLSTDGVVATPQYLATFAGAQALRDGGSAVDAAIAANLVLGVVWPHMCRVGGDLMAQVWSARDGQLYGLNSSGRAGAATVPVDAVLLESRFGEPVAADLANRGHRVAMTDPLDFAVGTVQLIQVDSRRGCYTAVSDPRGDGTAMAV